MEPEQQDNAGAPHVDVPGQKHDTMAAFVSAAKDSAQEALIPKWLRPFFKWLKTEWSGVKTGRKLIYILIAIALGVGAYAMHKWDSAKIESLNSHNSISNSFLLGKLAQGEQDKRTSDTTILSLKADNIKLATEKAAAENKAAAAENRAAFLETVPLQATSNLSYLTASQPTNQQRLLILLDAVQTLTNAVQILSAALRPSVSYVNVNTNVSTNQP